MCLSLKVYSMGFTLIQKVNNLFYSGRFCISIDPLRRPSPGLNSNVSGTDQTAQIE